LLLVSTPDKHHPHYIVLHTPVVSLAGAFGPLVSGDLLEFAGQVAVFGLSGIGRALGLVLFFALFHEPVSVSNGYCRGCSGGKNTHHSSKI